MKPAVYVFLICVFSLISSLKAQENKYVSKDGTIEALLLPYAQLSAGKLYRVSKFPSKYIKPRTVNVWLPDGYSEDKKYAVIYMHDGQMLFDSTITWNHQEWKVDEVASQLMTSGKTRDFIVVGIYNIYDYRYGDLFPEKAFNYLTEAQKQVFLKAAIADKPKFKFQGDAYLQYLVNEIKPFIDASFSTLSNRENTFVAGSSMGGLMSWYAMCEYPEIFGGAACLSTHWPGAKPKRKIPVAKAFFKYIQDHMPDPKTHKIYFDFGTKTLDKYYTKFEEPVNKLFYSAGYNSTNFKNVKFEGESHTEESWQKRLYIPLTFLMKN